MNYRKTEITNSLELSLGSELTAFEAMEKAQIQRERFCPVCGKMRLKNDTQNKDKTINNN